MRTIVLGCVAVLGTMSSPASAQSRDWAFVQSVGGLVVGEPSHQNGAWYLPIRCNVSGIQATTTKPTSLHSALACSTVARLEDQAIVLTVVTRAPTSDASAACPPARLGVVPKGRYKVFYSGSSAERILIGEVNIAL